MKQQLKIIRGLPGSGKTTLAQKYVKQGFILCEADQFFKSENGYIYDPAKIVEAHEWCYRRTLDIVESGRNVVIANTFSRHWEFAPYLALAEKYNIETEIITANGNFQNQHNVPDEVIEKMRERWENF